MLRVYAEKYIELGQRMADAGAHFSLVEGATPEQSAEYHQWLSDDLKELAAVCEELSLKISTETVKKRVKELPTSEGEFSLLLEVVKEELKARLLLFVPPHLVRHYNRNSTLTEQAKTAFPTPFAELRAAGNAVAFGLPTASVFHSMRAAEIGVRCLATALGVTFGFPIELAEWGKIVGEIEPKIEAIKQQPRSLPRDADLQFYSEAASQFRHFNDGWRVRVSHARATYEESQALRVLQHTREFFETLATRLKE
jgi:AcrR family transcriptional regulator